MDTRPVVFFGLLGCGLALALICAPLLSPAHATLLQAAFIMAALAVSFQIVFGLMGQLSLGHSALFGTGAYTYAALSLGGLHPLLALVAAAFAGGALGVFASAVTARLGGAYFAVVTYALASVIALVVSAVPGLGLTDGLMGVPSFGIGGLPRGPVQVGVTALTFGAVLAAFYLLWRSRFGWMLESIRENGALASALGINVPLTVVAATAVSGVFAGTVGAIYAQNARFISPDVFGLYFIVTPLAAVVIGGSRSLVGAVLGTIIALVIPLQLSIGPIANQIISGTLMTAFVVLLPAGVAGLIAARFARGAKAPVHQGVLSLPPLAATANTGAPRQAALDAKGVSVRYGANQAVRDLSVRIERGEVVGLIGPNGAGKSSFVNALSGLVAAHEGSISIDGRDITAAPAHQRVRQGLSRTFQNTAVIETLTVRQSLELGQAKGRVTAATATHTVDDALHACGLVSVADIKVGSLTYMHRRLTAIGMALVAEPVVVCLDEATAGLTADERAEIGRLVRSLAASRGTAFLVIEHDIEFVATVADRIVVMTEGAYLTSGTADVVLRDPAVVTAYLGSAWNVSEPA